MTSITIRECGTEHPIFEGRPVRFVSKNGNPFWVGPDVAEAVQLGNVEQSLLELEKYEKISVKLEGKDIVFVNESGVFALIYKSRKSAAKRFKRWFVSEMLPLIRKFGMYPPPSGEMLAANDPYDGLDKPIYERFKEERLRWESETGYSFAKLPAFSKSVITSIEAGLGGTRKGNRVEIMAMAGLDTRYILTGQRNITPIERGFIDRLRQNHALMLES